MNKNDLGKSPAFPKTAFRDSQASVEGSFTHGDSDGMDIRTYIATKCLAGMLSDNKNFISADFYKEEGLSMAQYLSINSVKYADALIAELSKNT